MLLNGQYIQKLFAQYDIHDADVIEKGVYNSGEFDELDYYIVKSKDRYLGFFSGVAGYNENESKKHIYEKIAPELGVEIVKFIGKYDMFHAAEIKLLFGERAYRKNG